MLLWRAWLAPAQALTFTIPDTAYSIPGGAYYVDAATGNDSRTTTQAQNSSTPWLTLGHAVGAVSAGATIVLRAGTYRETVSIGKALTIQAYPHEAVWFKGSTVVTGWVVDGSAWRKDSWTTTITPTADTTFIDPAFPMAQYPDQVFVDTEPLTQVASQGAVTTGTFYVNTATSKLYIGTDPTGKTVEASIYPLAFNVVAADNTTVQGLGFLHYAPHHEPDENAAVRVDSNFFTFRQNLVAYSAGRGVGLFGTDNLVEDNSLVYNGEGGMSGFRTHRTLVQRNYVAHNNTEHFIVGYDANGMKTAQSDDMTWRDNLVEYNLGGGLWCDWICHNNIFTRNTLRFNTQGAGISYEKSTTGLIVANVIYGNETAIAMTGTSATELWNNTFADNTKSEIYIADDDRATGEPTSPGVSASAVLKNNLFANHSEAGLDALLFVRDFGTTPKTGEQMVASNDYNGWSRATASVPSLLVQWQNGGSVQTYTTLAGYVTAKTPRESHSVATDSATDPFFLNAAIGDYRLTQGSSARLAGTPLSSTVANAINSGLSAPLVTAGAPVNMGADLANQVPSVFRLVR